MIWMLKCDFRCDAHRNSPESIFWTFTSKNTVFSGNKAKKTNEKSFHFLSDTFFLSSQSVMQNFIQLKSLCNVIYFLSEHMVFIEFCSCFSYTCSVHFSLYFCTLSIVVFFRISGKSFLPRYVCVFVVKNKAKRIVFSLSSHSQICASRSLLWHWWFLIAAVNSYRSHEICGVVAKACALFPSVWTHRAANLRFTLFK